MPKHVRGFSVVELLVMLGVIAMLSSVLFPAFIQVKEQAKRSVCSFNEKQIGLAMLLYIQDNDDMQPAAASWAHGVYSYIHADRVYLCPDYTGTKKISYSMNSLLDRVPSGQVAMPSQVVDIFETAPPEDLNPSPQSGTDPSPNGDIVGCDRIDPASSSLYRHTPDTHAPANITGDDKPASVGAGQSALNYLFVDGHVKFIVYSHVEDGRGANGLCPDSSAQIGTFKAHTYVTFNYLAPN